jgi:hypothetical protein
MSDLTNTLLEMVLHEIQIRGKVYQRPKSSVLDDAIATGKTVDAYNDGSQLGKGILTDVRNRKIGVDGKHHFSVTNMQTLHVSKDSNGEIKANGKPLSKIKKDIEITPVGAIKHANRLSN